MFSKDKPWVEHSLFFTNYFYLALHTILYLSQYSSCRSLSGLICSQDTVRGAVIAPQCIYVHPWGLALGFGTSTHMWSLSQHPSAFTPLESSFSTHVWSLSQHPNSSTPLGSSSSTHHALLGLAAAPTCGACHGTPIHPKFIYAPGV